MNESDSIYQHYFAIKNAPKILSEIPSPKQEMPYKLIKTILRVLSNQVIAIPNIPENPYDK